MRNKLEKLYFFVMIIMLERSQNKCDYEFCFKQASLAFSKNVQVLVAASVLNSNTAKVRHVDRPQLCK